MVELTSNQQAVAALYQRWKDRTRHFVESEAARVLDRLPHKTVGLFAGNRGGKTSTIAYIYIKRLLGISFCDEKNRLAKKIRCISSTLPGTGDVDSQDNAQYIELRKLIPPEMILQDITARTTTLVVKSPVHGKTVFEFRSSKQEMQDLGKISVDSVWHDEETPKEKREECRMRLMETGGDEVFSCTATNPISYLYDEVYQQASYVFRTKSVVEKYGLAREEKRNTGKDIACIQMATDDNPILDKAVIDSLFEAIDDPDVLALRRYGIFKSISGRVFKSYDPSICYIPFKKYFPNGIPYDWFHCRGIDYHESRTPWSVGWMSVSPKNEWFLWREFHPPIDGPNSFTTGEITKHIARNSEGYYYSVDLIDPLATKKQPNTGYSVVEDLNREFHRLKEDDRIGTGAYFCGWDTKGTLGRDEISARFKNARKCQAPFNNAIRDRGIVRHLPTLWVCDTAPNFHRSLLNWCYGEWGTAGSRAVNDPKPVPQQKNSHDPMVLEAFAKDSRIIHAADYMRNRPNFRTYKPASITGR